MNTFLFTHSFLGDGRGRSASHAHSQRTPLQASEKLLPSNPREASGHNASPCRRHVARDLRTSTVRKVPVSRSHGYTRVMLLGIFRGLLQMSSGRSIYLPDPIPNGCATLQNRCLGSHRHFPNVSLGTHEAPIFSVACK